jgi:proline racemase
MTSSGPLTLTTVEVHAEGEPGRIVMDAGHLVRGDTMAERLAYCRANLDWLRGLVLHEPRGYPALCAVLVLPPVTAGADLGIIVLEQGGFTPMSGSNTMCAVAGAVAAGLVTPTGPVLDVTVDTAVGTVAAGLVTPTGPVLDVTVDTAVGTVAARADIHGGRVVAVTVANVPAYVVGLDVPLDVPELGRVPVDVVFGGQFFVQAAAADCGVPLDPECARDLVRAGALLRIAAREQFDVRHPLNHDVAGVSLVLLHSGPPVPGETARNTVVLTRDPLDATRPETWTGVLDRSPCGTGTCARMAALHARGELGLGEDFVHRSIIGSRFIGRLTGVTDVAGIPAVSPTVTGRTWITGHARWELDYDDPYRSGYTLPDIWPGSGRISW